MRWLDKKPTADGGQLPSESIFRNSYLHVLDIAPQIRIIHSCMIQETLEQFLSFNLTPNTMNLVHYFAPGTQKIDH